MFPPAAMCTTALSLFGSVTAVKSDGSCDCSTNSQLKQTHILSDRTHLNSQLPIRVVTEGKQVRFAALVSHDKGETVLEPCGRKYDLYKC
jgi:hypothetical protein